jgi:hypothetical protein
MPIVVVEGMKQKQTERWEEWRRRMMEEEESGASIRAYSKQHGMTEDACYAGRQRLPCR